MARIAGVDLPKEKQAWVSLQYLYGVGSSRAFQILEATKVKPETKMDELSEAELNRIREYIDREFRVEGFPTLILLNPDGKEAKRAEGLVPGGVKGFMKWIGA